MHAHSQNHRVAIFVDRSERHVADSCEPLAVAARTREVQLEALGRGAYPGRSLAPGVLSGVASVGFWDAAQPQRWGLDWHRNEGIEITFLERGLLSFGIGGTDRELKPGALTITRPWQPHRVGDPLVRPSRLHWLILDVGVRRPNQAWRWPSWLNLAPKDLTRLTELLRHNEHPLWTADAELRHCWQRIAQAVESDVGGSSHSPLRVHINELFWLVGVLLHRTSPKLDLTLTGSARTVELFLSELRHNREQQAAVWTLTEMAGRCGLGVTQFAHHCRELTNRTPAQYLMWCRLEAAGELLRHEPNVSVTEVALACGFASAQYFATAFRRKTGATPGDYRAKTKKA